MINSGGCPRESRMAHIALTVGQDMITRFAFGNHTVVTRRTGVRCHACVIKHRWRPRHRGMTVIARISTRNVVKVFAFSNAAVVATDTRSDDSRVIDQSNRIPGNDRVARLALVVGGDVLDIGAGGRSAVVTREAARRNGVVIKVSRLPRHSRVAHIALTRGG